MLLHVGLHTHVLLERLRKKTGASIFAYSYYLVFTLVLAAGILCFTKSSLWRNMLLLPRGNPYFESFRFYGEYAMITLAFCQFTHLIMRCLQKADGNKS